MDLNTDFLTPKNKLVDEVVDWLLGRPETERGKAFKGRVETVDGAPSLAHVCVVVPTAQSGRNLRLALAKKVAKRFDGKGLVPPMVQLPMQLAVPADESLREATDAEVAAAFLKFTETRPRHHEKDGEDVLDEWTHLFRPESSGDPDALFSVLDQLSDIWNILGAGGLLMRDVPESDAARNILKGDLGDEKVRWDELADLENAFFAFLHDRGLRHRAESIRLAKTAPKALPDGVTEVVLPALADPVPVLYDVLEHLPGNPTVTVLYHCAKAERDKFDEWGRPEIGHWTGDNRPDFSKLLRGCDIVCASTDGKLAEKIAAEFPEPGSGQAVPSLGLCDETLFDALSAAFLNRSAELHDPEKFRLSSSSLGRIANLFAELYAAGDGPWPWDAVVSLLREDDVLYCIRKRLFAAEKKKAGAESATGSDEGDLPDEADTADEADTPDETNEKRVRFPSRRKILEGLDVFRNAFFPKVIPGDLPDKLPDDFPETLPSGFPFDFGRFGDGKRDRVHAGRFLEAVAELQALVSGARREARDAAQFLRAVLASVFGSRRTGAAAGEKEFGAAAAALRDVLAQFEGDTFSGFSLSRGCTTALLRKFLADAVYSLEPDSPGALKTEGWLELAWSPAGKIALAGFNEGAVPDSVEGHVFLPDSLRSALGLPSNDRRLARDTFLLGSILAARSPGDVRAYFSRANDKGDIHRPSRLLFLVPDEAAGVTGEDLASRTKALFGDLPPDGARPARRVARDWRPDLPSKVSLPKPDDPETPGGRLSPSAIDTWLGSPFAYLLKNGLGMERVEERDEPGADDFGTLVHNVLEAYANEQLALTRAGKPQSDDEGRIADDLKRIFASFRRTFGPSPSLNVRFLLDSVERRILNFAPIQAQWAKEKWIVAAEPEFGFVVRPFEGEGDEDVWIKGTVDRIDYKEGVGYRLIDYKTWDDRKDASGHVLKGGAKHHEFALKLGLPETDEPSPRRFLSVQLPLYGLCLGKLSPEKTEGRTVVGKPFAGNIADYCYLVLGKTAAATGTFGNGPKKGRSVCLAEQAPRAVETARIAIRAIRVNLFWPPGPDDGLQFGGLGEVFLNSPAGDLRGSDWLSMQEARLAAFAEATGMVSTDKEEQT